MRAPPPYTVELVDLAPHAGAFVFAQADRFVVPIINLRFHEVRVLPSDDPSVGVVWGSTDNEGRRDLSVSGAYSAMGNGMAAIYARGMGSIGPVPGAASSLLEIPDMRAMTNKIIEEGSKERALERCDALRQDLMAAAWHPGRMRRWCLDHDDEFAESDNEVTESDNEVAFADKVHVMDGFLSHEELALYRMHNKEDAGDHNQRRAGDRLRRGTRRAACRQL